MTASLVGQAGPDQRPASRRRRESSEGRLGPLLSQQPTATIQANPGPPTSAVRGWPHWELAADSVAVLAASSVLGVSSVVAPVSAVAPVAAGRPVRESVLVVSSVVAPVSVEVPVPVAVGRPVRES